MLHALPGAKNLCALGQDSTRSPGQQQHPNGIRLCGLPAGHWPWNSNKLPSAWPDACPELRSPCGQEMLLSVGAPNKTKTLLWLVTTQKVLRTYQYQRPSKRVKQLKVIVVDEWHELLGSKQGYKSNWPLPICGLYSRSWKFRFRPRWNKELARKFYRVPSENTHRWRRKK